ncbi:MAG: SPOR domain-containing protein [Methylococcales bacterium]
MNTVETDLAGRRAMPRKPSGDTEKSSPLRPLVSNERSQKFDLLQHLISNIRDGIVVCGPKGIGKSTILDLVQAAGIANRTVCRINATSSTRFEEVLDALAGSISADSGGGLQGSGSDLLRNRLGRFKRDDRLLILLLDDAGEMAPGILTAVCQFADSNPALRPVFTMTADRLQLTLASDPAVANCQVIEIPPLTESQCSELLQNLSGKPGALISFKAIGPALIQYVYRRSYGVPGNVVALLPELSRGQLVKAPLSSLPMVAMITMIGAILAGYWLWKSSDESGVFEKISSFSGTRTESEETSVQLKDPVQFRPETRTPPAIVENQPVAEIPQSGSEINPLFGSSSNSSGNALPLGPDLEKMLSGPAADLDRLDGKPAPPSTIPSADRVSGDSGNRLEGQQTGSGGEQLETQPRSEDQSDAQVAVETDAGMPQPDETTDALTTVVNEDLKANPGDPVIAETESGVENESAQALEAEPKDFIDGVQGHQWIRQQDPRQFTLQLLAVTKLEAMKQFLDSHTQLDGLAIFRTQKSGMHWYALIKGVYPSVSAAKEAANKLPASLKNAWPRSFKSVHKAMIDSASG